MVNCQNVVCISLVTLGVFVVMMYRPSSKLNKDNNHLSQFIFNFPIDWEVILIGDFNLSSINWGNAHPFQGDFKNNTQAFVEAFVSSSSS